LHAGMSLAQVTPGPLTPTPGQPTTTTTGGEFPTLLLTTLIWVTLAAALVLIFMPERTAEQRGRIRLMALAGTTVPVLMAIGGLNYQINQEGSGGFSYVFEEKHQWITAFSVHSNYHLGVDGVSLPLLLLS